MKSHLKLFFLAIAFASSFVHSSLAKNSFSFSNNLTFGDDNSDAGRYHTLPYEIGNNATKSGVGAGAYTTNPGKSYTQYLSQKFGYDANPSVALGTNYAAGGAMISEEDGAKNAWSLVSQVEQYLNDVGGKADEKALYTIWAGDNDLKPTPPTGPALYNDPDAVTSLAGEVVSLVSMLHDAGAKYFIVPSLPRIDSANPADYGATEQAYIATFDARKSYDQQVWNGLREENINFIPADLASLIDYVFVNHLEFGITNVGGYSDPANVACGSTPAYQCVVSDLDEASSYFWADTAGHFTTPVHMAAADYIYSLIVAPSQISMLAESAVSYANNLNTNYQAQIQLSNLRKRPHSLNLWMLGTVQRQKIESYKGFEGQTANPLSASAGLDYKTSKNSLVGFAVGMAHTKYDWTIVGNYKQNTNSFSLYTAYDNNKFWATLLGTYSMIDNIINRDVLLNDVQTHNHATAGGSSMGGALQGGYKWHIKRFSHGPVVGGSVQAARVEKFREVGDITNLEFGAQNRKSAIGQFGYQMDLDLKRIHPFAKIMFNREFVDTKRNVTATLTSVEAPSYYMPAIQVGKKWGTLSAGSSFKITDDQQIYGLYTQQFSQRGASSSGVSVGYNIVF